MTMVHFKLTYEGKDYRYVHRFAPKDSALEGVKKRISEIVGDREGQCYELLWKGNASKPPCIQLEVIKTAVPITPVEAFLPNPNEPRIPARSPPPPRFPHQPSSLAVHFNRAAMSVQLPQESVREFPERAWVRKLRTRRQHPAPLQSKIDKHSANPQPRPYRPPASPPSFVDEELKRQELQKQKDELRFELIDQLQRPARPSSRPFFDEEMTIEEEAQQNQFHTNLPRPSRLPIFQPLTNRFSQSSSDDDSGFASRFSSLLQSRPTPSRTNSESDESGFNDFFEEVNQQRVVESFRPRRRSLEDRDVRLNPIEGDSYWSNSLFREPSNGWLLLQNGGNDCFLNAALQYMRRARDIKRSLDARGVPEDMDEKQEKKEQVLGMLYDMMSIEGRVHPMKFRRALPTVLGCLESDFLYTQQDAYEILVQIFDGLIPPAIEKTFHVDAARRRRCLFVKNCKGTERIEPAPLQYFHVEKQNQIIDLEASYSSEWAEVDGAREKRHCSECCPCCVANEEGHDEDKCKECKRDRTPYIEEQRFVHKGEASYALIAFNILHPNRRLDWALTGNCNLDEMKIMGHTWRAVAVIKHSGRVWGSYSRGHYVAYTKQDDGKWWLHDDDAIPTSIGDRYRPTSGMPYAPEITDMQGVVAILFEKVPECSDCVNV